MHALLEQAWAPSLFISVFSYLNCLVGDVGHVGRTLLVALVLQMGSAWHASNQYLPHCSQTRVKHM